MANLIHVEHKEVRDVELLEGMISKGGEDRTKEERKKSAEVGTGIVE